MRVSVAVLALAALTAGCGSGRSDRGAPAGSLESLWQESAQTVALIPGTNDYSPGDLRMSFLVVDNRGKLVAPPTARVWIARSLSAKPLQETVAHLEPIGVPGVSTGADAPTIYVAHFHVALPGKYYVLARPNGKVSIGGHPRPRRREAFADTGGRRGCISIRDSDACQYTRQDREAHDARSARPGAPSLLHRGFACGARAVRRDVRDAAVLHEPHVRTGRRRRRRCAPPVREPRHPLHPRRDLPGQRPGQRTESLGPRVEAAVRAVDVPGRQGRPGESEVLRSSFHRRARTRDRWGAPLAAGVETCECSSGMSSPGNDPDGLVSVREVADQLGVHPETIRRLIHDGRLDAVRVGRVLRVHRQAVDGFLARQRVKPTRFQA